MADQVVSNKPSTLGYVPALDGLRAIAVILVMLTHANFQLADNGILGVDIFFALSGFLITTLLLNEYDVESKISLSGFYIRRCFRLFPALYLVLIFVVGYALFFTNGTQQFSILSEVLSSALYLTNVSWVWGWGDQGILLGHTWSLAVEEQFYLVWPVILILSLRFKALWLLASLVTLLVVACVTLKVQGRMSELSAALLHESIFIGCIAAIIYAKSKFSFIIPGLVVLACTVFLALAGILPIPEYEVFHKHGGRSVVAILSVIIIIGLIQNKNQLTSKILSMRVLVMIGKISYGLYLWHVPVFRLFKAHSPFAPSVSFVLKFVVAFFLAVLSWILVERKATAFGRMISAKLQATRSKLLEAKVSN